MARTALYRAFDAHGSLLYVGISINALRRIAQHSDNAIWFSELASFEVEWFETRSEAAEAEKAAIQSEAPRFNIIYACGEPALPPLLPSAPISAQPTSQQAPEPPRHGLVGMAFHIFERPGPPQYQGHIVQAVDPGFVVVEYFEWVLGDPTTRALVPLTDIAGARHRGVAARWQLYTNVADMVDWYREREPSWQRAEDAACRTSATS